MRLDEIRRLIVDHPDRDPYWHRVPSGPYFAEVPDRQDTIRQHDALFVFRGDVDLTIQSGLQWGHQSRTVTRAGQIWDDVDFTDQTAAVSYADVFWRRSLVDRVCVVTVDGGRATLPVGARRALNSEHGLLTRGDRVEWEYSATAFETAVARIVDGDHEFDRYFEHTGMVVKD